MIRNTQLFRAEEKGREQANLEIAKKMIQKNIPMEQICEITGLDKKEIEKLVNK